MRVFVRCSSPLSIGVVVEIVVRRSLLVEEAVAEGGDENQLDEQADDRLERRDNSHRVAQADLRREEAAPMKRTEAEHQCLIPVESRGGFGSKGVRHGPVDRCEYADDDAI